MLPAGPLAPFADSPTKKPLSYARLACPPLLHPARLHLRSARAGAMLRAPGPSNTMAAPRDFAAQPFALCQRAHSPRPLHCARWNINAVIIPFSMIVGGARHEPIHRMHGMSLSTHPCQRHSVACGCDVVAVSVFTAWPPSAPHRPPSAPQAASVRACPASRSRPACHQP